MGTGQRFKYRPPVWALICAVVLIGGVALLLHTLHEQQHVAQAAARLQSLDESSTRHTGAGQQPQLFLDEIDVSPSMRRAGQALRNRRFYQAGLTLAQVFVATAGQSVRIKYPSQVAFSAQSARASAAEAQALHARMGGHGHFPRIFSDLPRGSQTFPKMSLISQKPSFWLIK